VRMRIRAVGLSAGKAGEGWGTHGHRELTRCCLACAAACAGGKDREAVKWSPPDGEPAEQQLLFVLRCLDRHFSDTLLHGGYPQLAPVLRALEQGGSGGSVRW
jgi:hypothetical protein